MADDITHYDAVEGYCGALSYAPGDTITLHVRCTTDRYDVAIHRWGATLEQVWSATDVTGTVPPTPADADANGCEWPVALSVPVHGREAGVVPAAVRARHDSPACHRTRRSQVAPGGVR